MEFAFRYEPEHLRTYQRLASHRLEAKNTDYVAEWWGWMLGYTLVAGAALAGAYHHLSGADRQAVRVAGILLLASSAGWPSSTQCRGGAISAG